MNESNRLKSPVAPSPGSSATAEPPAVTSGALAVPTSTPTPEAAPTPGRPEVVVVRERSLPAGHRSCPSLPGPAEPLCRQTIDAATCADRQAEHYHKCVRCEHRDSPQFAFPESPKSNGAAKNGTARNGSATNGSAKNGAARDGRARS